MNTLNVIEAAHKAAEAGEITWPEFGRIALAGAQELNAENTSIGNEEQVLRRMLAVTYAGAALYSDDGELQDNRALPYINFKSDSAADIIAKMAQRASDRMKEAVRQLRQGLR